MNSIDKLNKLANRFTRKIVFGQIASAQAGDVETVLRAAGLWDKSSEVSALLSEIGIPDDASVKINIIVDNKLDIKYHVDTNPPAAAIKLSNTLKNKYGTAMKSAIQTAKLFIADTVIVNWLTF